jgi:hypothetical protein
VAEAPRDKSTDRGTDRGRTNDRQGTVGSVEFGMVSRPVYGQTGAHQPGQEASDNRTAASGGRRATFDHHEFCVRNSEEAILDRHQKRAVLQVAVAARDSRTAGTAYAQAIVR